MRNQGVEVMLSGDLISRKDMALTLSGNFSYNKNKLFRSPTTGIQWNI